MKFKKSHKFLISLFILSILWISGFFALQSFKENIEYYMTPTQVLEKSDIDTNKKMRVGGLIIKGSIKKLDEKNHFIKFFITDFNHEIEITYNGTDFPPIFKDGIGIIARGYLIDKNHFSADQLIGKHDENYKPKMMNQ